MALKAIKFPGGLKLKPRRDGVIDLPDVCQVGIIPFRQRKKSLNVLMITSQTRNRWVFPKGNAKRGESALEAGIREGFEEAGVVGEIIERFPLGVEIAKSTDKGMREVPVVYYPFLVHELSKKWPEAKQRQRRWFEIDEARKAAGHRDIIAVIERFGELGSTLSDRKLVG